MPDEDKQNKEQSRISVRIGEVQVELEGTYDNIKKLMGKELFDFTKGLQEPKKPLAPPTEITPEVTSKVPEVTSKDKTVTPPSKPSLTSKAVSQPSRVSTLGKTTEKKSQRKIFGKMMIIALGVICIVLVAGLVGTIAVYLPMVNNLESQIAQKDNTISSLYSQISSLNSQVYSLEDNLTQTTNELLEFQQMIPGFNQQIAYYLSIINLNESAYLFATQTDTQLANTSDVVYNDWIDYAGIVSVIVESSSNTTYAQVIYSSYGVNYDNNATVGTSGTAVFPVLPGEIEIRVGNTEPVENVTATVDALYRY